MTDRCVEITSTAFPRIEVESQVLACEEGVVLSILPSTQQADPTQAENCSLHALCYKMGIRRYCHGIAVEVMADRLGCARFFHESGDCALPRYQLIKHRAAPVYAHACSPEHT